MSGPLLRQNELKELGERALSFQRYIFRRAWGVYYAIWSAALVAYFLVSFLPFGQSWIMYDIFFTIIGWAAGAATSWTFRTARRTMSLRTAIRGDKEWRRRAILFFWTWPIIFTVSAFLAFAYFHAQAAIIIYAMLTSVIFFLYYGFRASFGERTPFEGKLAITSFALCIIASLLVTILSGEHGSTSFIWMVESAVWMYCSLYALWHAPQELAELSI